jgi:hypothetical protein
LGIEKTDENAIISMMTTVNVYVQIGGRKYHKAPLNLSTITHLASLTSHMPHSAVEFCKNSRQKPVVLEKYKWNNVNKICISTQPGFS